MPSSSPYGNLPIPASGDSDQVWAAFATYAAALEPSIVRRFSSAAERTSYLTAGGLGTGVRGMVTWLDSNARLEVFTGSAWVPVAPSRYVVGTAIKGANWDGISQIIEQRFSYVITTGALGSFSVVFPLTFPNGVFSVAMTPGDGALGYITHNLAPSNLVGWAGNAYTSGAAAFGSGSGLRIEVNAIGW